MSYHAISAPQLMHAEPGLTIERRSGTRAATTFRKQPECEPRGERERCEDCGRPVHRQPVMTGCPIVAGAFGGTGAPGGRFVIVGSGKIFVCVPQS